MPYYLFQHPKTKEVREIFFLMNDEKNYHGEKDESKVEWKRIFTVPQASIDVRIDPFDKTAFIRKTEAKKDTFGAMWDQSAELSKKREEKLGHDPVKEAYFDNYKKHRNGVAHSKDKRKNTLTKKRTK